MRRDWTFIAAVAALTVIAVARVASTYPVFSATVDESTHLAGGYQWLTGRYTIDLAHPPLARVLGAIPLRLMRVDPPRAQDPVQQGNDLLYSGNRYRTRLACARSGTLLFLIATVAATATWARRRFSRAVTLLAVAMLTSLPPLLGHAGVVTNDLAATAALVLAVLAVDVYLDAPSLGRAFLIGAACAVGTLSKFSFLVFFPPSALILIVCRWPVRTRFRDLGVAALTTAFLLWGGYRFDVGTPAGESRDAVFLFHFVAPQPARHLTFWLAHRVQPAPGFAVGLAALAFHDQQGHAAYLLGKTSDKGWWQYFPLLFFYKTPLPFLMLVLWGVFVLVTTRDRARLAFAGIALAVLLVAMTASINIGIRHILPMFPPLSVVAAHGAADAWRRATGAFSRLTVAALLVWLFAGAAAAHPDYLAWFNEAAQPNPARIAVDSNLDWGQDILRLAVAVRELHIRKLHISVLTNARLEQHAIHAVPLDPFEKTSGWVAISETVLALGKEFGAYTWLSTYRPVRRIGKSIRLYYIP